MTASPVISGATTGASSASRTSTSAAPGLNPYRLSMHNATLASAASSDSLHASGYLTSLPPPYPMPYTGSMQGGIEPSFTQMHSTTGSGMQVTSFGVSGADASRSSASSSSAAAAAAAAAAAGHGSTSRTSPPRDRMRTPPPAFDAPQHHVYEELVFNEIPRRAETVKTEDGYIDSEV